MNFIKTLTTMTFVFSSGVALASDFASAGKSQFTIWPEIVFSQGADFANFDRTIQQDRDMVRRMLWNEFSNTAVPMVISGADATCLAPVLAQILLAFDQMHAQHVNDSYAGVSQSLEALFHADFEAQFTKYAVPESSRRALFVGLTDLTSAVGLANQGQSQLSIPDALKALTGVDYLMSAVVSIADSSSVNIALSLQNYRSGETRAFNATGEIQQAIENLAEQIFNFFQSNQYDAWVNPQPNLTWIPAAPATPSAVAATVQMICKSQGARVPYTRELILASAGSAYQPGGIPPLNAHDIYVVADRQRWNQQHYYFTSDDTSTGGPIRTSAGFGSGLQASYWCVKGDVDDSVMYVEGIYQILRGTWQLRDAKSVEITKGLEYILTQLNDYGARNEFADAYPDLNSAKAALRSNGIIIP